MELLQDTNFVFILAVLLLTWLLHSFIFGIQEKYVPWNSTPSFKELNPQDYPATKWNRWQTPSCSSPAFRNIPKTRLVHNAEFPEVFKNYRVDKWHRYWQKDQAKNSALHFKEKDQYRHPYLASYKKNCNECYYPLPYPVQGSYKTFELI